MIFMSKSLLLQLKFALYDLSLCTLEIISHAWTFARVTVCLRRVKRGTDMYRFVQIFAIRLRIFIRKFYTKMQHGDRREIVSEM